MVGQVRAPTWVESALSESSRLSRRIFQRYASRAALDLLADYRPRFHRQPRYGLQRLAAAGNPPQRIGGLLPVSRSARRSFDQFKAWGVVWWLDLHGVPGSARTPERRARQSALELCAAGSRAVPV